MYSKTLIYYFQPNYQYETVSFFVLYSTFFASCGNGTQPNTQDKPTVKIGMVSFQGYAPLYLAKEKGFFDGVNVELKRIEAISDLRAALTSGSIDMYAATYDIFQATEAEPPGIGFLAIDGSNGGDGVVVSEEIKTLKDLKGKKIAAEPGLPPYFILQYLLDKEGMTLKDVVFKDMTSQDIGAAFISKHLDAGGTYEPYLSKCAAERKGSRILVSSKDTPGLVSDLLFSSDKMLKEHPELLQKIAEGWFKAVEYYKQHPDESLEIMAKAFSISKQELVDIKSGIVWYDKNDNIALFDAKKESNVFKTFDLVGSILKKNGSNKFPVSAQNKLTSSIIAKIK